MGAVSPLYFPLEPQGLKWSIQATVRRTIMINRYILPQALPFPEVLPVFPPP